MCAWTCFRRSEIIRCADLLNSCVSVNDVNPCTIVAATTASTMGTSNFTCFFPITSSIRYLVDPGRISPATRLIAISTKPSSRIPLRGWISAQISGKELQSIFFFALFAASAAAGRAVAVVAMKRFASRRVCEDTCSMHLGAKQVHQDAAQSQKKWERPLSSHFSIHKELPRSTGAACFLETAKPWPCSAHFHFVGPILSFLMDFSNGGTRAFEGRSDRGSSSNQPQGTWVLWPMLAGRNSARWLQIGSGYPPNDPARA